MSSRPEAATKKAVRLALLAVLMVSVGASCGTRVNQVAASPTDITAVTSSGALEAAPTAQGPTDSGAAPEPSRSGGSSQGSAAPVAPVARQQSPSAAGSPGGSAAPSARPGAASPAAGGSGTGSNAAPSVTPQAPLPGRATAVGSDAAIASVGTLSGPAGALFLPYVEAVRVWVKYVNDKGGVNGHKVRLNVYDDGGDPSRHRAQVQEAVEQRGVIAFVQQQAGITGSGSIDYISAKRIPVIGNEGGSDWFYEKPMFFPPAATAVTFYTASVYDVAKYAVPAGRTKTAVIFCIEAQACGDVDRVWGEVGPKAGMELVYRAKASIGQPDFTAECLNAQKAGAKTVFVAMDTNSVGRLTASCARQGYRPVYAVQSGTAADRMTQDPNLEGMTLASPVFPWFQSGTPATDEYQQVMRSYGKNITPGPGSAVGWVTAKLFEKATAHLPEPPTSEAVLRGLWSVRDDTLGGLTLPLTFVENQPAKRQACWFSIVLSKQAFVSPDGSSLHCQ